MPRRSREQEEGDEEMDNALLPLLLRLPNLLGQGPSRPGWMPWRLLNILMLMDRATSMRH